MLGANGVNIFAKTIYRLNNALRTSCPAFFGEHFDEDGMGNRAVDDEHAFDTGFDGVSTALDFGDHAAGNDASCSN